ncbi:uncharacterized protein LOC142359341 [Opisthocomus hoazin]|uniref:uncharacterized protein LOC142359341 n=1 Tax=Opisthocomus hoazin TaxID=30419 RepID=UPI003F53053E
MKLPALLALAGGKASPPPAPPDVVVDFSKPSGESDAEDPPPASPGDPQPEDLAAEPPAARRRASSADDVATGEGEKRWRGRRGHEARRGSGAGAVATVRSVLLSSTSDSELARARALGRIPQISLNFVDLRADPCLAAPPGEKEIIAPTKLKERTHNVTEKVTQVSRWPRRDGGCSGCGWRARGALRGGAGAHRMVLELIR